MEAEGGSGEGRLKGRGIPYDPPARRNGIAEGVVSLADHRVRVALIGGGNIARLHARAYSRLQDQSKVVAVCDTNRVAAEQKASELHAERIYDDYHQVLNDPDVEAVDLCLPHILHAPIAIAAAEAGKHVLTEKPMATSMAEAVSMVEAASAAGTMLMVGQNQRYMPEFELLRSRLQEGLIGRITAARTDCNQYLAGILPTGHWLYSREQAGGGVVISVAVHKLDLLRYLVGDVRRACALQTITGINQGMDCEDMGAAILEFENGAVGEVFFSYAATRAPWNELLILYGTEGTVHDVGGLFVSDSKGAEFTPLESGGETNAPDRDSFTREVRHYLECIRSGAEPRSSGRDNLGTMAVIDAIYRSAVSGAFESCAV